MAAAPAGPFDDIETARLLLRLVPPAFLEAGLAGDLAECQALLGARVPPDLLDAPAVLKHAKTRLDEDPRYQPWSMRALVDKHTMAMVGHIRFHTSPDPDYLRPYATQAVEFGYEVFAGHRRQRYAYEAVQGVMQWARERHDVHRFVATVSPDNLPSLNLIARFDFRKIGEHVDPADGVEGIYLCDGTANPGR
jgi:RimJ/RimL family protein N-acetyltransferase